MQWLILIEVRDKITGSVKRGWRKCKNWDEVRELVGAFWKIRKLNGKKLKVEIYRGTLFKKVEGKKIIWN